MTAARAFPCFLSFPCSPHPRTPDEHDVRLSDVLLGVRAEEQVAAPRGLHDLLEAGLVDGERVTVPRLDALLVAASVRARNGGVVVAVSVRARTGGVVVAVSVSRGAAAAANAQEQTRQETPLTK